jgi:nicotinamidase-related amidase
MFKIEDSLVLVIDFQVRLMPFIHKHEELEKKVESFIKGCRILELPILTMQQYTKGLGDTSQVLKDALGEFEHIEKITFSCCGNEEFVGKLEASGKKNIIVTGIESHICVQQTVLDLLTDGYNVYVIADCIGSRSEVDRVYAEKRMRQAGAVITTMESVLFELLTRADHPKRKEISNLVK